MPVCVHSLASRTHTQSRCIACHDAQGHARRMHCTRWHRSVCVVFTEVWITSDYRCGRWMGPSPGSERGALHQWQMSQRSVHSKRGEARARPIRKTCFTEQHHSKQLDSATDVASWHLVLRARVYRDCADWPRHQLLPCLCR